MCENRRQIHRQQSLLIGIIIANYLLMVFRMAIWSISPGRLFYYTDIVICMTHPQKASLSALFFSDLFGRRQKKDVVLCRQNTVQWCNGSTTDSGPVCPSSNLGWTTLKTWRKVRFYFYSSPDYFNIRVSIRNTYRSSIL